MKKYLFLLLLTLTLSVSAQDEVLRWSGDTLYVNTTTLCPEIKGYNDATPVLISIYDGKVVSVQALRNRETRSYFRAINKLLMFKWNGQTVDDALALDVDVITGATLSSQAVIGHVRAGLAEAQKLLATPVTTHKPFPVLPVAGGVLGVAGIILIIMYRRKQK